jgi:NTE family protein
LQIYQSKKDLRNGDIVSDNLPLAQKDNVIQQSKNLKQRALILSGGGALGAYQVGVLKILFERLTQEDNEKDENNRLLFDIVAGTSIGAMNGAVLVSQYLETRDWQKAIEQLKQFWTNEQEGEQKGLASRLSEQDLEEIGGWKVWREKSNEGKAPSEIASVESARRYYSVWHYVAKGAPRVHKTLESRKDLRFFDNPLNEWRPHSSDPLRDTILNFVKRPISTSPEKNEPRLLVFAVDAAEGETVTFDSYPKADGSRKSEYGKYTRERGYENVIKYDEGINIDHIMASGTLPVFYDYKDLDGHKFWDGGLLSNTPFREFLQAYHQYWHNGVPHRKEANDIPVAELEVYIVNLHPSKRHDLPTDHDGEKDRLNDIIFGDRSSQFDERQEHLAIDLQDFAAQLKHLSEDVISRLDKESDKKELKERFEKILITPTSGKDLKPNHDTYDALLQLKNKYKLTKVVRIERANYTDAVSNKTGDFSAQTINELIAEGMNDAAKVSLI